VGAGNDIFFAHDLRETHDALGYQLRVLDEVARVPDDAGDEDLPLGQLHVLPDLPLVLVPRIARLDRIGARVHFQNDVRDVPEGDIVLVRTVVAAPAHVQPHLLL